MTARGWRPDTQTVAELFREELESRQLGHLADSQWILPIIDGLDEIDASSYEAAIKRIREHSADRKPFIATSRTQEYVDATRQAGHTPAWAAVIELDPITALQVCSYLTQDSPDTTWWAPVTDKLASDPAGPLARALSTPLMAWLARATLTPSIGPHSPTPLDLAGVASLIEARQLLLNHYLPTQYRGPPTTGTTRRPAQARHAAAAVQPGHGATMADNLDPVPQNDLAYHPHPVDPHPAHLGRRRRGRRTRPAAHPAVHPNCRPH